MIKILVVDDEADIVDLLKACFEAQGYLVLTAYNGEEALQKLEQNPDLILLDVMMPGKDGFEICSQIRAVVDCPIIFLTAKVEDEDIIKGLVLGADDYLLKPFNLTKEYMSYSILTRTGEVLYQQKKQELIGYWDSTLINQEQTFVKGWVKPYVHKYIPIIGEEGYRGSVLISYPMYPTSKLSVLKILAPYFNLIIIGTPFVILLIVIAFYARKFFKTVEESLHTLQKGMLEIQTDNLDFELSCESQDEIGQLCISFETMRRALKESLESNWRKEEERKSIISGLSHDLRTPLTVINGYTELMLEDILTKEQRKQSILAIQKNTKRLMHLVQSLNQVNKWQQADLLNQKEATDLEEFLKVCIEDYNLLASSKNIKMEYHLITDQKIIEFNVEVWHQILDNLISNSLRYTPQDGRIIISLEVKDEMIQLNVEDSGCGFKEKELEQAVIPFYQGDKSRNSGQHYGIGLYIVDYLVKKMEGELCLYQSHLGGAGVRINKVSTNTTVFWNKTI